MKPAISLLQGRPYVDAANTNIAETFRRYRKAQADAAAALADEAAATRARAHPEDRASVVKKVRTA